MIPVRFLLAVVAGSLLSQPGEGAIPVEDQAAQIDLSANIPNRADLVEGKLDNGIRYLILPNARPEKRAELRLVIKAGSILEDESQLGFAHFVEHMAFNGTEDFEKQELVDYVQSIGMRFGAHLNAYTSFDETVYMLQVPTDDPAVLEKGIHILENQAWKVSFDPAEIDAERGVVVEEWRLRQGAQGRIQAKQFPVILKDSHYAERLPIGTKENLENGKHEDLIRFYRDWYRPDLMTVVVAGDFGNTDMEGLISRYFGQIPARSTPARKTVHTIPDNERPLVSVETDPELTRTTATMLIKKDRAPTGRWADRRQTMIGQLFTGMLNQRLGDLSVKGEAPWIGAGSGMGRFIGGKDAFTIGAATKPGEAGNAMERLLAEVQRVVQHGYNQAELDRAKAALLKRAETSAMEKGKRPSAQLAQQLVQLVLHGTPASDPELNLAGMKALLPSIALGEVNSLAGELIQMENSIFTVSAPDGEKESLPAQEQLAGLWDKVSGQEIAKLENEAEVTALVTETPKPGKIVSRSHDPDLDAHTWILSNGAKVILKQTDFKNDQIVFRAFSKGGSSLLQAEDWLSRAAASVAVTVGGIGEMDQVALNRFKQGKQFNVTATITPYSELMRGNSNQDDLQYLMQNLHLQFVAPRNDAEAFAVWQNRMRPGLENRFKQPAAVFAEEQRKSLHENDPRSFRFDADFLDKQDFEKSFAFYQDRFAGAGDFSFVFVGNLDLDVMEELVSTWVATIPAGNSNDTLKPLDDLRTTGPIDVNVTKGIADKAQVSLQAFGELEWSLANETRVKALSSTLTDLLRERLREDKGGVYGAAGSVATSRLPEGKFSVRISFSCDPARVDELIGEVRTILDDLRAAPMESKYVDSWKEASRKQWETAMQQNAFWADYFVNNARHDGNVPSFDESATAREAITPADVRDMAEKLFSTENWMTARLLPESSADSGEAG